MTTGQQLLLRQRPQAVDLTLGDPVMRPRDDGLTIPTPPGGWMREKEGAIRRVTGAG